MQPLQDEAFEERKRFFQDYLENQSSSTQGSYLDQIRDLVNNGGHRLLVNVDDVRRYNEQVAKGLIHQPFEYFTAIEAGLQEVVRALPEAGLMELTKRTLRIGLSGHVGECQVTPRGLHTGLLGRMVDLQGIVTSCSLVRPKLVQSVHKSADVTYAQQYHDAMTSLDGFPAGQRAYPKVDEQGRTLKTVFSQCLYRDSQVLTIQEMPESAPAGQMPRSVDVVLLDDLVDSVKPGDRVQLMGIYRALGSVNNSNARLAFRSLLLANSVSVLGKDVNNLSMTENDIMNIRKLAKKKNVFDLLSRSLAPSIRGHEWIKRSLLLMLVGGVEKNLENGTHLRGDINIMMVGDPSTAKSQLLRFVLGIAPLAIATTGRGSSGVGLTAAVLSDKETGERRLEAGAMVLADRGIVCIDEFDKMSDLDRVAIHEVMEQQTVTIAKAGIHTTLNARCSVLAAANPVWGHYKETATPQENIRLPDSLLSRFDLLFIVLDEMNPATDRNISQHVIQVHRSQPIQNDDADVYQSYVFAGNEQYCSVGFVKRYIHYAKARIVPVFTTEASELITAAYSDFRNDKQASHVRKTYPVTVRTLETLIRLATAHAKIRLSKKVEKKDARVAIELVEFCLYKEVKPKKKKAKHEEEEEDDEEDEGKQEPEVEQIEDHMEQDHQQSNETLNNQNQSNEINENVNSQIQQMSLEESFASSAGTIPTQSIEIARQIVGDVIRWLSRTADQTIDLDGFVAKVREKDTLVSISTIESILYEFQDKNIIMYRDNMIMII